MVVKMKVSRLLLLFVISFLYCGCSTPAKFPAPQRTTIIRSGYDGKVTIRVKGEGRTVAQAKEQAKRNAVRELLIDGIAGNATYPSIKPLVGKKGYEEHEAYFQSMYSGNRWKKFVSDADMLITDTEVTRAQHTVLVRCNLELNVAKLKRRLQRDKIIPGDDTTINEYD